MDLQTDGKTDGFLRGPMRCTDCGGKTPGAEAAGGPTTAEDPRRDSVRLHVWFSFEGASIS